MALAGCVLMLWPRIGDESAHRTTLRITGHSEEGGRKLVSFELVVPPGKEVAVLRSHLTSDYGTGGRGPGPPEWVACAEPRGTSFGPNTRTRFTILEPPQRLQRLSFEVMEIEVGPRAWPWKARQVWATKKLSAWNSRWVRKGSFYVRSGLISTYAPESRSLGLDKVNGRKF